MQLIIHMQILQSHQQLSQDNTNVLLAQRSWLHEIRTTASSTEFHDDPEVRAAKVGAIVFGDMVGVKFGEDGDLLDNIVDFIFGALDVDHLDSDSAAVALIYAILS